MRRAPLILVVAVATLLTGCTSTGSPPQAITSTVGGPTGALSTIGSASSADCDRSQFGAAPISTSHNVAVPPVPAMTAIRPAQHPECGYDRITFDVTGPLPGYRIEYVDAVIEDGSGKQVEVPGNRFLVITFTPTQANGLTSVRAQTLNYPMLTAYSVVGDFEGTVRVALGMARTTGVRVGELPGRIYVDVAE
jgi:hypothetical protein